MTERGVDEVEIDAFEHQVGRGEHARGGIGHDGTVIAGRGEGGGIDRTHAFIEAVDEGKFAQFCNLHEKGGGKDGGNQKINNIARTTSVPEGGNHREQQMPWD